MYRLLAVLIMLFSTTANFAQDETNPRDVVLQAFADLQAGYHFAGTTRTTTSIAWEDDEPSSSITLVTSEGDVTSNGDHLTMFLAMGAETESALPSSPSITFERVVVDGIIYLNIGEESNDLIGIEAGWFNFDDYLASTEESVLRLALEGMAKTPLPSELPFEPAAILKVVELESALIDGLAMRVFELSMNPLALALISTPGLSFMERVSGLVKSLPVLLAGKFSSHYQVWIGAEDHQLYKVAGEGYSHLPYGIVGGPDYDIETRTTIEILISQHGTVEIITAPELDR